MLPELREAACRVLESGRYLSGPETESFERELARLEDTRNREAMRWEQMKTPDKVESALLRHGLSMRPPKASQNVHMSVDGQPCPGQYSVNTLRQRNAGKAVRYKKAR